MDRAGNRTRKESMPSNYVKTKPATIDCATCGVEVPVQAGRGRKPKFCPEHRGHVVGKTGPSSGRTTEPYTPRSLADHPALLARQAKHGKGAAGAHRPLGIRTVTTTGKVPRRRASL
jgi:hypothetical protein